MKICMGHNCKSTDGTGHSLECMMEHDAEFYPDAGNNFTEDRYSGYKKEPLGSRAGERRAAWWKGYRAREDVKINIRFPELFPGTAEQLRALTTQQV